MYAYRKSNGNQFGDICYFRAIDIACLTDIFAKNLDCDLICMIKYKIKQKIVNCGKNKGVTSHDL